jgi:hypothetical protein
MASKAQRKQDAELRRMRSTGSFKVSQTMHSGNTGTTAWTRANRTDFDYNDEGNFVGIIDAQLARANYHGMVAVSQFGYGTYDVKITAVPFHEGDPYDTVPAVGKVRLDYVAPSPVKLDALRELKKLEALDDDQDFVTGEAYTDGFAEVNPLLTRPLNWHEETEGSAVASMNPTKGSKIIRFGYDEETPAIQYQSALTVNLNLDGDVTDQAEKQKYTLMGNGYDHFGVLWRYEDHVNAPVDDGVRRVEREWAYPLVDRIVAQETTLEETLYYAHDREHEIPDLNSPFDYDWAYETANSKSAVFKNVVALGGLIKVTIPDWVSRFNTGSNNDFRLLVELTCKKWTPMAN